MSWTIQSVLDWTREHFTKKGFDSPRLDAELLLADALGVERIYLYTHFDKPLNEEERGRYRQRIERRMRHEPVAYILGRREFWSRDFEVSPDVLVPRPETEHLVEQALAFVAAHGLGAPRLLDVGTGSGALAVSLACELPSASVVATDISAAALAVARRNADRHGAAVELLEGDLFAPLTGRVFDVIVSNPPYVEAGAKLPPDVADWEPKVALFGGQRGLDVLARLCGEATGFLASPGFFACEIDPLQSGSVRAMLERAGLVSVRAVQDLSGQDRAVVGERP